MGEVQQTHSWELGPVSQSDLGARFLLVQLTTSACLSAGADTILLPHPMHTHCVLI